MWRWREVADARAAAIVAAVSEEALRVIWLALPVEDRARCACVCRGWRDSLADPALWTCMRPTVRRYGEAFDAALRAMAAKAAGRLEVLDLSGLETYGVLPLLLELTTANSGTLRELGVQRLKHVGAEGLLALLHAAPHLQVFHILNDADVGNVAVAMRMLRNEGVYRPLRLGGLALDLKAHVPVNANVDVHALASAVAAHASLRQLRLYGLWMPDVASLDALVDAALTRKLYSLTLDGCFITSAFAPSLARLIGGGYLESIRLAAISTTEAAAPFFDSAAISVLAPALLSNIRLTNVNLSRTGIWADLTAAAALFASLAAHPSLRLLAVYRDEPPTAAAVAVAAAAYGALVAASSLASLVLIDDNLDDVCLGPLFVALPANTRLRALHLTGNRLSKAFVRDRVLPAVRANTSLNDLVLDNEHDAAAREAMDFVMRRRLPLVRALIAPSQPPER